MPGVLIKYRYAPVAQGIEQRSSKPKVVGSNPTGGALVGESISNNVQHDDKRTGDISRLFRAEESVRQLTVKTSTV